MLSSAQSSGACGAQGVLVPAGGAAGRPVAPGAGDSEAPLQRGGGQARLGPAGRALLLGLPRASRAVSPCCGGLGAAAGPVLPRGPGPGGAGAGLGRGEGPGTGARAGLGAIPRARESRREGQRDPAEDRVQGGGEGLPPSRPGLRGAPGQQEASGAHGARAGVSAPRRAGACGGLSRGLATVPEAVPPMKRPSIGCRGARLSLCFVLKNPVEAGH